MNKKKAIKLTKKGLHTAKKMMEYFISEKHLPEAAVAYAAIRQMELILLLDPDSKSQRLELYPHDEITRIFINAVKEKAIEVAMNPAPAIVELEKIRRVWSKRFRNTVPPIKAFFSH